MKSKKLIILMISVLMLTGCTKTLKGEDKKIVKNETTGQSVTENIICQPTDPEMLKIYEKNTYS